LEYAPRTRSIYSDLGFILLGLVASWRGGRPLASQLAAITDRLSQEDAALAGQPLTYGLHGSAKASAAPTVPLDQDMRPGQPLAGEVHDNYAATPGNVTGDVGLVGAAGGVAGLGRARYEDGPGVDRGPAPVA